MASIGIVVNGRISSTRCPQKLIRPFGGTTLFDIAMSKLSELSQYLKIQNISHVIDLIFYMDKRSEICNLNKFYRILEEKFAQDYHIFYCPENFVGIQLIPRYKQKKLPTVLFFSSCTSIYLSKRNLGLLIPIKNKMNKIINDYISEQY